jgi:hypothetical protein
MSFPDLTLKEGGALHSQGQGVPVDGDNEFDAGIDLERYDNELSIDVVNEWLRLEVFGLGDSVEGATFVSRNGSKITLNFTQSGADEALVLATLKHSSVR